MRFRFSLIAFAFFFVLGIKIPSFQGLRQVLFITIPRRVCTVSNCTIVIFNERVQ